MPEIDSVDPRRNPAKSASLTVLAFTVVLASSLPAGAWGGKTRLARKYRPGESMVYQTKIETRASVHSNPSGFKAFLPPLPTELSTRQQNTVTVKTVHGEGTADVETRFDRFEIHSDLIDRLPEADRRSAQEAEQDFSRRMTGRTLTAHYDLQGRLLGFEGVDDVLGQLDAPLREPLRRILTLFLEQMSGEAFYPGHSVKPGDEWKKKVTSPASDQFPFGVESEETLRYVGKTRYRGVKAAIVDYRSENALKPSLRQIVPLASLEAMGVALDLGVKGQGQGRLLVALDDGRVLENRSTLHETLIARLKGPPQISAPNSAPLTLEVDSQTTLEVDGSAPEALQN